ncbi:GNAT family N-acetyltransferase [Nocardioides sp. TRM66260-LWL]|uniref:GNAT family N-acetyltransferase n=1 Tax=Nocardioides sp. TRM66260-LWL TaxID=2874478 RepID=UPI001CC68022|nr:GNAT family N-acetyltransferase [Nocardioides sp. TRM66260-LWL]MBZ5735010.1 GNAT family N-acetyltransferase [Nocardioides sp. TRM66260-LWL]
MSAAGPVIEPVTPTDVAAVAAWNDVVQRAERHGREATATPWTTPEMLERLRDPVRGSVLEPWMLRDGPTILAASLLEWRTLDNLDRAAVAVGVDPAHRRRGHGSRLLDHAVARVRELGRPRLTADGHWPIDAPADGAGTADAAFLQRHGFSLGVVEIVRSLSLPVGEAHLDALAADAARHHAGYRVVAFAGAVPEPHRLAWGVLAGAIEAEAPTGSIEVEPETLGPEELDSAEAMLVRLGRTPFRALALAPDGDLVAYTEVVATDHEPDRAYQDGTLVRADHRGHRLGLAVKVAALRLLQEHRPGVRHVLTWNAEVNAPMIRVNELLGFRPVERAGWFERRL